MKVLVTGATGMIGSHLVRRLLERGNDVRILRRSSSLMDLLGDAADSVEHAIGDIFDREAVDAAMTGVEVVFHAAGAVGLSGKRYRQQLRAVNVTGTATVVNAALDAGIGRLVHTSSIAALGRPAADFAALDETAEWVESSRTSEYARSKYHGELEVHRGVAEGLDAVILNPSLVFGVGREGENTVQIIQAVRDQKLPAVPVGGTNVVDVEDVVEGHLRALSEGATGERYILGSENLSWREIIDTIAAAFNVPTQSRTLSPRLALALGSFFDAVSVVPGVRPLITRERARQTSATYEYDNTRAQVELGCSFRPFAETIRRIAGYEPTLRPTQS